MIAGNFVQNFNKLTNRTFLSLLLLVVTYFLATAEDSFASSVSIEDIISTQHLVPIGELYTDGQNKLLCVKTSSQQYALWNPVDNSLLPSSSPDKCNVSSRLKLLNPLVTTHPANENSTRLSDASFANGNIYLGFEYGISNCEPNFDGYYDVTTAGHNPSSFYLILKQKKPVTFTLGRWCEVSNGNELNVKEQYNEPTLLSSIDLGKGVTLIYSYGYRNQIPPLMLLINGIPDKIWSSDQSIFLVPKQLLYPALHKAGSDPSARYRIVTSILSHQNSSALTSH